MALYELIRKCLSDNREVTKGLALFDHAPAVFTPEAPPPEHQGWNGQDPYPRIVFQVDMGADEEGKCQGSVALTLSAGQGGEFDLNAAALAVGKCLCGVVLTPDEERACCLGWNQGRGPSADAGGGSIKLRFDILEYHSQETMDPDPVEAVNAYLKEMYPEAMVMHHDPMGQVEELSARPVFYCSLQSDSADYSTMAVAYMDCIISIHVFSTSAGQRAKYSRAIARELELQGGLDMSDGSPLMITSVSLSRSGDYLRTGQVQVGGRYGILRQTEEKKRITKTGISDTGG